MDIRTSFTPAPRYVYCHITVISISDVHHQDGALLHWNCNPSKARDEGQPFRMTSDGSEMSIVNLLSARSVGVNSFASHAGVLVCGTDNETLTVFFGVH
jgi:hypothetical protein